MAPDLTVWSRRVPLAVVTVLTAGPLLALLIAETLASPPCSPADPCRPVLRSVAYVTDAPVVLVAYALVVLPFLFPRAAVWWALLLALAVLAGAGTVSHGWGWAGGAVLWAVLGGLDLAGRRRQGRLSSSWAPGERPPLPDRPLRWDEDTRRLGALVALVLLLGAATLSVLHGARLRGVERFEAAATPAVGRVVDPGVAGLLVLDVDGRTYEIGVTVESYRRGERLPLLVDPATGRVSLVAEPLDPSWLLGLAAVAVVVAGCAGATLWSRGRRRVDLVRDGGPAVELLLSEGRSTVLSDLRLDGRRRDLLIGDLIPVEAAFVPDRHDHEQPLGPDQLGDTDPVPRPVTVIGRLVDGYPVLVRDGPHLLLSSRAIRDPWTLRRLLRRRSPRGTGDASRSRVSGGP